MNRTSAEYPHELPAEPGKWYENDAGSRVECVAGMMTGERAEAWYAHCGPWREIPAPAPEPPTNRMSAGDEPMTQLLGFTVVEFNQAGGAPYLVDSLTDLLDSPEEAKAQIKLYEERQAYGRRRDRWQVAAVYIDPEGADS